MDDQKRFIPQIRLGDVVTVATIALASTAWFFKTDSRLQRVDEIIVELKAEDVRLRQDMKEGLNETRADVKETRFLIERVLTRIDRNNRAANGQ